MRRGYDNLGCDIDKLGYDLLGYDDDDDDLLRY